MEINFNRPTEGQINSAIAALRLTMMEERKRLYFNQEQYDDKTQTIMQQRINDKVYMIDFLRELLLVPQYFELGMIDKEMYERWRDSRTPHFEEDERHICQTCEADEDFCQVKIKTDNTLRRGIF